MAHGHASVMAKPFTPLVLSPVLWLDASDSSTITASSGAVSQWNDKSANGYTFTQATAAAQPTTGTKTQNSLNVLSFDGGDSLVSTAAASTWKLFHDGTNYLVGIVAKRDTAGTQNAVMSTATSGSAIGANFRWLAVNTFSHYVVGTGNREVLNNGADAATSTATRLVTIFAKPSNATPAERSAMWIDGGTVQKTSRSSAAPSSSDPTATLWIGNRSTTAMPLTGTIAEIIVVTGNAVTDANRTLIHNYLNAKWAVY